MKWRFDIYIIEFGLLETKQNHIYICLFVLLFFSSSNDTLNIVFCVKGEWKQQLQKYNLIIDIFTDKNGCLVLGATYQFEVKLECQIIIQPEPKNPGLRGFSKKKIGKYLTNSIALKSLFLGKHSALAIGMFTEEFNHDVNCINKLATYFGNSAILHQRFAVWRKQPHFSVRSSKPDSKCNRPANNIPMFNNQSSITHIYS